MRLLLLFAALAFSAVAVADINCSRAELQQAVDAYIAAQTAGNPESLPLAPQSAYFVNMEPVVLADSIVNEALAIDFHRSLLDEYTCQTFTEVIVTDERNPYVIGTRMRVIEGTVTELESIVTDEDDWLFNPGVTYERSAAEDWGVLPASARSSRADLEAAANAYFDQFFSGPDSRNVPFGTPCNRLEGGIYSGRGTPEDSCTGGFPNGMNIVHRRFVTDEALGATVGLVRFGPDYLPDTHMFRLVNGRIRYVHTLTVCLVEGCGFGAAPPGN